MKSSILRPESDGLTQHRPNENMAILSGIFPT